MGPSKMLITPPLQIQNSWQLSFLELPPCCTPTCNTVASSLDSSNLYTSTVQPDPPLLMLPSCPTLAFNSHPPCAHFVFSPSAPSSLPHACGCSSMLPASSAPLIPSGFFNGMLAVSEPGTLNCYTFFHPIPLTLFVSRNPILTHLPLSGSLDFLLCDLMTPTPGLALFLLMACALMAASLFLSGRASPSLNFLPPLFLRLTPLVIL